MKTHCSFALAVLAGIGLGVLVVQGIHAQAKPPAYVVVDVDITNQDGFMKNYAPEIGKIIADGGGKYLARGGKIVTIEGAPSKRLLVIGFENFDKAEAAFTSAAYEEARKVGYQYAKFRIVAVEGVPQ